MDKWADGWIDTGLPSRIRKVGTNQVEASVSDPTTFAAMMPVITSLVQNMCNTLPTYLQLKPADCLMSLSYVKVRENEDSIAVSDQLMQPRLPEAVIARGHPIPDASLSPANLGPAIGRATRRRMGWWEPGYADET